MIVKTGLEKHATADVVYLPIRHGVSVFALREDLDIPPDPWDIPRFRLARFKDIPRALWLVWEAAPLAEALMRLGQDETLAQGLAENGHAHVTNVFDIDSCLEPLLARYRAALEMKN